MRALPKADPEGLASAILLAFLATAGLFYVNIMPALVDALRHGLGFTAKEAGLVGSANMYGAAVGSLAAALLGARLPWRGTAVAVLVGLLAVDLASMLVVQPGPLIALRFVHGVIGGLLVGVGVSLIARSRTPDRGFGVLIFLQFGLGSLGVVVIPRLTDTFGNAALFGALVSMSVATLAMIPFLAPREEKPASETEGASQAARRAPWLLIGAILSIFFYQASAMILSAYLLGMGEAFGLERGFVSASVGAGSAVGVLGALAVVALGGRLGRSVPILGAAALTILTVPGFVWGGGDPAIWTGLNVMGSVLWAWIIPYIYALCSAFDSRGQTALWAGFLSKLGLASGPALGAFILAETHYERLLWTSAALAAVSGLLAAPAALKLDRLGAAP